jgi:hypothetical protein
MTITKHGRLYKITGNGSNAVFVGYEYKKVFSQASEYFWRNSK